MIAVDNRPGLLISVRDVAEAQEVAQFPVDVLDLKEPRNGPLGPCAAELWHRCLEQVVTSGKWSVALGESTTARPLAKSVPAGVDFAKAGPAGLARLADVQRLWEDLRADLPDRVQLVAVCYADHADAGSPMPEAILGAAVDRGITTVLVDTFTKGAEGSLQRLGRRRIADLVRQAAEGGCEVVLAGGLRMDQLADAVATGASRLGIRGDLCAGDRSERIDPRRLRRWVRGLEEARRLAANYTGAQAPGGRVK